MSRDGNPSNPQNWKVVCSACGEEFLNDETIELVGGHNAEKHPDLEHPHFNTIWIGKGPAPKQRPGRLGPRGRRH